MLQRRTAPNGVVFYASPLLERIGVAHAFSTRLGGTSPPPFDSLNLGNPTGCDVQKDDYPRILGHYRLLQRAAGCPETEWCRMHQVHGNLVHRIYAGRAFDKATKGDALVSDDTSRAIAVRVADCVPVLLATDDGKTVGAAHAGWRGVVAGVVGETVREMKTEPERIIAAIGPCIGFADFEVGSDVLDEFTRTFGREAPIRREPGGKGRVDLRECVRGQLLAAGIPPDHIDTTDRCTFRDESEFYSHRRDKGVTGRMAAIISPGQSLPPRNGG